MTTARSQPVQVHCVRLANHNFRTVISMPGKVALDGVEFVAGGCLYLCNSIF